MAGTGAIRQQRLKEKRLAEGIIHISLWIPKHSEAEYKALAEAHRLDPTKRLEVFGVLRGKDGRFAPRLRDDGLR